MHGVNKFLFTNLLCPWWCTEYIHMVGNIQMDIVIQLFLRKALLAMPNDHEKCWFVNYWREDYIRDTKYNISLFNEEEWTPRPSIEFFTGVVPVILTCRNHSGGTQKSYIHPPRQPNHVITSTKGYQLFSACIKTLIIKKKWRNLNNAPNFKRVSKEVHFKAPTLVVSIFLWI